MVNLQSSSLDRTFAALADPTRRALVMRLAEAPDISVSALAAPFPVSLPAIMKHLDVLSERLDRLAAFLEEEQSFSQKERTWPPKPPQNRASPSSAGSTRRRPRSSRRGPTRKK